MVWKNRAGCWPTKSSCFRCVSVRPGGLGKGYGGRQRALPMEEQFWGPLAQCLHAGAQSVSCVEARALLSRERCGHFVLLSSRASALGHSKTKTASHRCAGFHTFAEHFKIEMFEASSRDCVQRHSRTPKLAGLTRLHFNSCSAFCQRVGRHNSQDPRWRVQGSLLVPSCTGVNIVLCVGVRVLVCVRAVLVVRAWGKCDVVVMEESYASIVDPACVCAIRCASSCSVVRGRRGFQVQVQLLTVRCHRWASWGVPRSLSVSLEHVQGAREPLGWQKVCGSSGSGCVLAKGSFQVS